MKFRSILSAVALGLAVLGTTVAIISPASPAMAQSGAQAYANSSITFTKAANGPAVTLTTDAFGWVYASGLVPGGMYIISNGTNVPFAPAVLFANSSGAIQGYLTQNWAAAGLIVFDKTNLPAPNSNPLAGLPKCYELMKLAPSPGTIDHRGEKCLAFRGYSPIYYAVMPAPGVANYSLFMDLSLAGNNTIPRCTAPVSAGYPANIAPAAVPTHTPPTGAEGYKSRCYREFFIVVPPNGFLNSHSTIANPSTAWVNPVTTPLAVIDGVEIANPF
jgi:hypothetical protein